LTDSANLKSKAISGSVWSLLENFSTQIVQFVVGIILARLLEPRDYGLVAIVTIFTTISTAITDAGFEKTLIQKSGLSKIQVSTIFYINLFLGLLVMLFFVLTAPWISTFFNEPKLVPVLQVGAIAVLLTALGQTQQALLTKELKIKVISYAKMLSSFFGAATGIILAYSGYGVWALVFSMLVSQVVKVLIFWFRSGWYPSKEFSYASVKPMMPYGMNVLFSSIIFFALQQFNNFVVGKFYSKAELGLFNRGGRFPEIAVSVLQGAILNISLPVFSKLQHQKEELQKAMERTIKVVAFVTFPMMILMMVKAEDITIVLLTEKWRASIIFFQLFCIANIFEPLISIHRELILAQGKSKQLLVIFTFVSIAEVTLILSLNQFGIVYIIVAAIISKTVQYICYTFINARSMAIPAITQLRWLSSYLLLTAVMAALLWVTDLALVKYVFTNGASAAKMIIELVFGALFYLAAAYYFKFKEALLIKPVYSMVMQKIAGKPKNPVL
jgi:teichuronic acid exporter